MKKIVSLFFLLCLSWHFGHSQNTVSDGDWYATNTWYNGVVPDPSDNVLISHYVTAPGVSHNGDVEISDNGSLVLSTGNDFSGAVSTSLTGGNLIINDGFNSFSNTITINDGGTFEILGGFQNNFNYPIHFYGSSHFNIEGGTQNQFFDDIVLHDAASFTWQGGINTLYGMLTLSNPSCTLDILVSDAVIPNLNSFGTVNFGDTGVSGYANIDILYSNSVINIAASSNTSGFSLAGTGQNYGTITINPGSGITQEATSSYFENIGTIDVLYDYLTDISGYFSMGSNFQNYGTLNIDGILYIRSGSVGIGDFGGNPPVYSSTSNLIYEFPEFAAVTHGDEWTGNSTTVSAGVPQDITLKNLSESGNFSFILGPPRGLAGSMIIEENTELILQSQLTVGNSFINNGSFTDNSPGSTIMNGNGIIGGSSSSTFNYLTINADVQLETSIQVNARLNLFPEVLFDDGGSLDLNGHNVDLGTTGQLWEPGGIYSVFSSGNGGALLFQDREVGGSLDVPAGMATLSLAHDGAPIQVDINRVHAQAGGGSINKYYEISGSPTGDISMEIYYSEYDLITPSLVSDEANGLFTLHRYDEILGWIDEGGTHNSSSNTVSQTGLSGFSIWTIAGTTQPLPVTFLYFNATQINDTQAEIKWGTATEINNQQFEVQRSENGTDFSTVEIIAGAINSDRILEYSLKVSNAEDAYFRLKQVDLDGSVSYSKIVFLNYVRKALLQVFPNPSTNVINIKGVPDSELVEISIMDVTGKLVYQNRSIFRHNITTLQEAFKRFDSGNYFISIHRAGQTVVERIIKQ